MIAAVTAIAYTAMTTTNTDAISWSPKMVIVEKELVKSFFSRNIQTAPLGLGLKYIEHPVLEQDIRNCIHIKSGGEKIVWAPPGTG
jgi:hypothetical protein